MSREIKFKAFDPSTKHMFGPQTLEQLATTESHIMVGWDNLVVMQYTGLKDKNGKEIYEGDIVEVFDMQLPEESFNYQIQWTFFGWFPRHLINDIDVTDGHILLEVIGNIMENPELLK